MSSFSSWLTLISNKKGSKDNLGLYRLLAEDELVLPDRVAPNPQPIRNQGPIKGPDCFVVFGLNKGEKVVGLRGLEPLTP